MEPWSLEYYETTRGNSPVAEFLDSLSSEDAACVTKELDLLEELGLALSGQHVKRIQGSRLWELRVRGKNDYRVFYVAITGRRLLLLHGFSKKTRKTPRREILVAEQRLADYNERHGI